jgi:serine/threonine-protein kinase
VIGRVVGKYRLLAKIGEGGMGSVFRAEHTVLGSPAAVKVLLSMWTEDEAVVDRFFHEAKAASAIHHVGIVDVFDFGRLPNDQAWIAMEYLPGENLTELLARSAGRLDPAVAQVIAAQLLAALDAAHLAGVIHRDLKPDNICWCAIRARPARCA